MEVAGGAGVAVVVSPAPGCCSDVGVDQIGVGAVFDEETGEIGVAGFGGVVQWGLRGAAVVDVESEVDESTQHCFVAGRGVAAQARLSLSEVVEQVGVLVEKCVECVDVVAAGVSKCLFDCGEFGVDAVGSELVEDGVVAFGCGDPGGR